MTSKALALSIMLLLAAGTLAAQVTTGRLIGTVVDDAGGALAGVTVAITSPALIGGAQTKVTDDNGEFSFVGIAPGEYTVKVVRGRGDDEKGLAELAGVEAGNEELEIAVSGQ